VTLSQLTRYVSSLSPVNYQVGRALATSLATEVLDGLLGVPIHVATSKADNNFSASWRDLEIQIQPLYELERCKELVMVLQVEGSSYPTN
jgi:hypothetical protein